MSLEETRRPAQPAASVSDEREAFEAWYFENVNRAELPDYLPALETYSSATVANLFCAWKSSKRSIAVKGRSHEDNQ